MKEGCLYEEVGRGVKDGGETMEGRGQGESV